MKILFQTPKLDVDRKEKRTPKASVRKTRRSTVPQVHARLLGANLGAGSPNIDAVSPNPLCAQVRVRRTDANLGHRASGCDASEEVSGATSQKREVAHPAYAR
jgi:hypothetical protein